MSTTLLNEYFLSELDDTEVYDRPFFSVNSETDDLLLEFDSVNKALYGAYANELPHAYDWDISGMRLPYNILMQTLRDFEDYTSDMSLPNLILDTALTVASYIKDYSELQDIDNLQVFYKESDSDGHSINRYKLVTGLQALNALRQILNNKKANMLKAHHNVISCSSDVEPIGYIELTHYIDNSHKTHPPTSTDMEFVHDTDVLNDKPDNIIPAIDDEIVAGNLLVSVQSSLIAENHDALCNIELKSSDWIREIVRKFKHPKYRLKKACYVAEKHSGVFGILVAPVIGKPFSSIQKYLERDGYNKLSESEKIALIRDIKPLVEAISSEV